MSFSMTYTSLMLTTPCEAVWGKMLLSLTQIRIQRGSKGLPEMPKIPGQHGGTRTSPVLSEGCLLLFPADLVLPGCLRSEAAIQVYSATLRGTGRLADGTGNHGDKQNPWRPPCPLPHYICGPWNPLWGGFGEDMETTLSPNGSHGK